jgi:hypothetical protein
MNDSENLQDYDAACFPTLKSALELDGISLEDVLKLSKRMVYSYSKEKNGWYEEILYAGLAIPVLVHGKSSYFAWEKVKKWTFHHAKKLGAEDLAEPYFEVWVKD